MVPILRGSALGDPPCPSARLGAGYGVRVLTIRGGVAERFEQRMCARASAVVKLLVHGSVLRVNN